MGTWGVDVVMISELYAVPKRGESCNGSWFGSEDGAAAILFSSRVRTPRPRELSRGEGFVLVGWGNAVLVSVYASPNRPVSQFENPLHALAREIDRFGEVPSHICLRRLQRETRFVVGIRKQRARPTPQGVVRFTSFRRA